MHPIDYLGHYIHGAFELPQKGQKTTLKNSDLKKSQLQKKNKTKGKAHFSPADFDDHILTWPVQQSFPMDQAFKKADEAYLSWTKKSLKERAKKLAPLKQILKTNLSDLSQTISRETGKPLWESEREVKALIGKINFTLGEGLNRIREKTVPQALGRIRFKSRGTLVVIGPFNFPLHLPMGQILPALTAGNTVLFKPSEKTPISGQKLAECFDRLNLPPGVFQMIQGGAKVSEELYRHKGGAGVLFTGSFEVGQKIKENLIKDPFKILALEMGGYNSALIWDDKDQKKALEESLKGCFWSAGQRCSSTSQIILHKKISADFIKHFVRLTKTLTVDHWSKNPFMGSLIDKSSIQRFFSLQREVKKRGGKILLEGKQLKKEKGYYVSPGIYKMDFDPSSSFGTKETFTPQVILYETSSLDSAVEMINHSGYGLSLSLFAQQKSVREEIFHRAKVGLINYGLSSVGASGYLPFGGLGKSGNDRPAGAFAIDACVSPLAEKSRDGVFK